MDTAQNIDVFVDQLLQTFISEKNAAMCSALTPIAVSGLSIYWLTIGVRIADGTYPYVLREVIWKQFRISWILALALSAGIYQLLVADSLDAVGVAFIETIAGSTSFPALLDRMAEPFDILGSQLWSKATVGVLPHAALLFAAALVSLAETALFSVGLGFYLLAKVSLSLVLAVGPAFILCAIWPSTMKYTESWLGQALNYMFLKVLICVTVSMLTSFVSQYAQHISTNLDTINILQAAVALLFCTIALVIIMLFHPQLANALFGGAAIAGAGRAIAYLLLNVFRLTGGGRPSTKLPPNNTVTAASRTSSSSTGGRAAPLYQRNAIDRLH